MTPTHAYGSDQHGLICGYVLSAESAGRGVTLPEARAWLATPEAERAGFLWLHFNLADRSAEKHIEAAFAPPPEFFEALRTGSRSTRIEIADERLVAVVNDVAYKFSFDPSEISTLWLAVAPSIAISARVHPSSSIDRLREAVKNGSRFDSTMALLNHLLRDQGDVLVRIVREATHQVDDIEDRLLAGRLTTNRAELSRLRRVLVRIQRLLAPEPGALFRLLRDPPTWIAEADLDELRQSTEEFSLTIRDLVSLEERIKLLQEEIAAQVGEQTNRSVYTLTIVTVLALPINMIAGLLGMNVGGIPLAQEPHGFAIVVAVVAVITAVAAWFAFRRRD